MKQRSKKILFFGNERLATGVTTSLPILTKLIEDGYEICAIIVAQEDNGSSRKKRQLEIADVASRLSIPLLAPEKLQESLPLLSKYNADAAILVSYGKLVPQTIIDLFPMGIINVHPSLLPAHRGSTPLESVLLQGETLTGVSLMKLVAAMDAGPVYIQEKVSIDPSIETKQQLADKLSQLAAALLSHYLPTILNGALIPSPQDNANATYDVRIAKTAGQLDEAAFEHFSAQELVRQVRAYAGWPRTKLHFKGIDIIITRATSQSGYGKPGDMITDHHTFGIYTKRDIFIIQSLIPSGKREMSGKDFLLGYASKLSKSK